MAYRIPSHYAWILLLSSLLLVLYGCNPALNAEVTAEQILRKEHPMAPSVDVKSTESMWTGVTKTGRRAHVVKIIFFAQNNFGATVKNCAYVAFAEADGGDVSYRKDYGVNSGNCDSFADPQFTEKTYVLMIAGFNGFVTTDDPSANDEQKSTETPSDKSTPVADGKDSATTPGVTTPAPSTKSDASWVNSCFNLDSQELSPTCADEDIQALVQVIRRKMSRYGSGGSEIGAWLGVLATRCGNNRICIETGLLAKIEELSSKEGKDSEISGNGDASNSVANKDDARSQAEAEVGRANSRREESEVSAPSSNERLDTLHASQLRHSDHPKPSFDCALAENDSELAICSDRELARLDGELGRLYKLALERDATVRSRQREWIRIRNRDCGSDVPCLRYDIEERITELESLVKRSEGIQGSSRDSGPVSDFRAAARQGSDVVDDSLVPSMITNRPPRYPPGLMREGIEGEVLLRILVSASGRAQKVEVEKSSGYREFDRSAVTAAKNWSFRVPSNNETAPAGWAIVPVKFELDN